VDARSLDALVYVGSGVLEVIGLVLTVVDITMASRSLRKFLDKQPPVIVTAIGPPNRVAGATQSSGGVRPSPEQRLDSLETWRSDMPSALDKREDDLLEHIRNNYGLVIDNTYKTFMGQWREVRRYLAGQNRRSLRLYLGPGLVFAGIVLALLGNLLNIYFVPSH